MKDETHHSVFTLLAVILVLITISISMYLGFVPNYVGKIVAEAGNVTRLNFEINESAGSWDGIYGSLTLANSSSNYTASGGGTDSLNLTVPDMGVFLDPARTIFASTQSVVNISNLVPADPSDVDAYLGVSASATMSGSRTFTNTTLFIIDNKNMTLNSTFTNSPVEPFDLGILKDNDTNVLVFVSHIKPGGTSFDGSSADFQMMLPVPATTSPTYFLFIDDSLNCALRIDFRSGINWFSVPCEQPDSSISTVLEDLGRGAGTEHDVWTLPGCTGDAADNFVGNYSYIWTYNASDVMDPWDGYNPAKPCFDVNNQDIKRIIRTKNYQITVNVSQESILTAGSPVSVTYIDMEQGLNWVGYPSLTTRDINTALDSLGSGLGTANEVWGFLGCTGDAADNFKGNYTMVWTYNASDNADPWKGYNPAKPCFDIPNEKLQYMVPGAGYQIEINSSNETLKVLI